MSDITVLPRAKGQPDARIIEDLELALEYAKAGQITHVVVAMAVKDDTVPGGRVMMSRCVTAHQDHVDILSSIGLAEYAKNNIFGGMADCDEPEVDDV